MTYYSFSNPRTTLTESEPRMEAFYNPYAGKLTTADVARLERNREYSSEIEKGEPVTAADIVRHINAQDSINSVKNMPNSRYIYTDQLQVIGGKLYVDENARCYVDDDDMPKVPSRGGPVEIFWNKQGEQGRIELTLRVKSSPELLEYMKDTATECPKEVGRIIPIVRCIIKHTR